VHSRRAVPTQRSAYEFTRGACGGVLITSVPASGLLHCAVPRQRQSITRMLGSQMVTAKSSKAMRILWRSRTSVAMS
jgi:hypothetical protein